MPMAGNHFTASGFFLKIFDCLCIFVFVSFWSCFSFFYFFASLCITKSREIKTKKEKNITTIYELVEQTFYCVAVFTDYHVKRALSLCVI